MNVGDLTLSHFAQRLAKEGVAIRSGPFVSRVSLTLPELAAPLHFLYGDFPIESGEIADFHVHIRPLNGLRGWLHPKGEFLFDGRTAFQPFDRRMALVMFERGLNWCIYKHAHQFLIFHAAAVEKDGHTLILPGPPGAGKSTLCAALVSRGWRLLSDELALIRPDDDMLLGIARAVSLKDKSIDAIRSFAPDAMFGPEIKDTDKGTLVHMRPPSDSVRRVDETASPAWIVFPTFEPNSATQLAPFPRTRSFFRVADNAINFQILGATGFHVVCRLIEACACYELTYSSLEEAVALMGRLQRQGP